jgi:hypothetical protein
MATKARSSKRPQGARVHRGTAPSHWTTLQEGVRGCFPAVESRALGAWQDALSQAKVEPEVVLFVVLVCGVQFQVYRIAPEAVMHELRAWLARSPGGMRPQLADVVVRALAPGIKQAVDDQWKAGPQSEAVEISGRPPDTKAAWAAAALVEELLAQGKVPVKDSERLIFKLLELLIGRAVEPREYDRRWRAAAGSRPSQLVAWLSEEYERLIKKGAQRQYGPEAKARPKDWRERHRALTHLFSVDGFEAAARSVAVSVPPELWDSLGGAGFAPIDSTEPGKSAGRVPSHKGRTR